MVDGVTVRGDVAATRAYLLRMSVRGLPVCSWLEDVRVTEERGSTSSFRFI